MSASIVAQQLEKLRKLHESDRAFAKRAGLKWVTTLRGILDGAEPREATLATIAKHLKTTVAALRYGTGRNTATKNRGKNATI